MRLSRSVLLAALLLVVVTAVLPRFCRRDQRQAIRVEETRLVVTNLTRTSWSGVTVWLNDYYRAQAPALAPHQRLEIPFDVFVSGWGQRFDRRRQAVAGIEVTARGDNGKSITLTFGSGRRR